MYDPYRLYMFLHHIIILCNKNPLFRKVLCWFYTFVSRYFLYLDLSWKPLSEIFLVFSFSFSFFIMVKLFYFFYLNRNDLSFSFIVLSFYRSFKRIQKRLKTFDTQDKVFFFFFSSAILIGLTGFYYLENPGLKIVELYFIMPVFCSYLYIITKKIFNNKYFPIFWLVLIACYPLTTVIVGIQAYCCDGIFILEEFNTFEISFITKELLNFFNGVFNLSDHNKYTECQSEKSNNIFNRELPEISPFLRRKYTEAFLDSVNHAGVAGGFAHIVKNNSRITVATGITVGLFSFITKVV